MPWAALGLLLAINAALAGFLAVQLRRDPSFVLPPVAAGEAGQASASRAATGSLPGPGPLESYADIWNRPLFLPGRLPFAPVKAAAVAPAPAPGGVPTLKGMVVTAERAIAIFLLPDAAQYVAGEIGSAVGSWKIEDISPEGVRLRRGATTRLLVLEDRGARLPAPGPGSPESADKNGATEEAQSRAPR